MTVPKKIPSPAGFDSPLFHPGQVLSDAELTQLGVSAKSRLSAETRRHGWGVVRGLLPRKKGDTRLEIGSGVVVDQAGQLFVLEDTAEILLSELLAVAEIQRISDGGEPSAFDLWLSMGVDASGRPMAYQWPGRAAARAPTIGQSSSDDEGRPTLEALTATVELRPANVFDTQSAQRLTAFENFVRAFNGPAGTGSLDAVRVARLDVLAKAFAAKPTDEKAVALGRVWIARTKLSAVITKVDWSLGRRTENREQLPARDEHVNITPTFNLSADQAVSWLARRGIQTWTVKTLTEQKIESLITKNHRFLDWRVDFLPGKTVRLYVHNGRVLLARKGGTASWSISKLSKRLSSLEGEVRRLWTAIHVLFLLLIVTVMLEILAHWLSS
ncbi:hypothetical protein X770_00865 [Mesorhizobium sp. LSJC269B00]|uniref:hypothetical protein n=1 Tax=Mesorhizobium sp. LSJC269B00 TaxID=1287326 RepID=UPI0003CF9719|nr:hypothetical protein [Mesorhizobium sp. LSJC269B00]ESW93811.1 hypothetical protein X770_00865 [Mesorhizobium sp. LSJC269B00]